MKTAALKKPNVLLRDEWLQTVQDLQTQIKTWAKMELDWSVEWGESRNVEEKALGIYTATDIHILTPNGKLIVEPIARNYPGRGIVELFAWPTLYRVRLIQDDEWGGWRVRTDSGIYLRQEWDRNNFITLANDLLTADA